VILGGKIAVRGDPRELLAGRTLLDIYRERSPAPGARP